MPDFGGGYAMNPQVARLKASQIAKFGVGDSAGQQALVTPLVRGNIDLQNRPRIKNPDGTTSTVFSKSYDLDGGRSVLVPGVRFGLDRQMNNKEAWEHYKNTGEHLGIFRSREEADAYARKLHEDQAATLE